MSAKELYNYILQHMTAEKALLMLLEGQLMEYKEIEIKFKDDIAIHPILLISIAAAEMNWQLAIPNSNPDDEVIGITVGTKEYMENVFGKEETTEDQKLQKLVDDINYHNICAKATLGEMKKLTIEDVKNNLIKKNI